MSSNGASTILPDLSGFKVQRSPTQAVSASNPEEALAPSSEKSWHRRRTRPRKPRGPEGGHRPHCLGALCVDDTRKQDVRAFRQGQETRTAHSFWEAVRAVAGSVAPGEDPAGSEGQPGALQRRSPEAGPPRTQRPQHPGPASGHGRRGAQRSHWAKAAAREARPAAPTLGRPPLSAPGPRPNIHGACAPVFHVCTASRPHG